MLTHFRPLAGKLRAKTTTVFACIIFGHDYSFPSPCGEIKGQNLTHITRCRGTYFANFRPLAGKLRAKTKGSRNDSAYSAAVISVPLRGN